MRVLALLSTLALPIVISAQERQRVVGTANGVDGSPWIGARVELRSAIPDAELVPLEVDVVVATTDPRGRFFADVIAGRDYVAWAESAGSSDGATMVSRIVGSGSGPQLELRAVGGERPVTRLGFGAMGARIALVRVFEPELRRVREFVPIDSAITIPASPAERARIEVLDREGHPLAVGEIRLDGRVQAIEGGLARPRRVRVVDEDEDNPIVGASIGLAHLGRILPITVTDDNGSATVDLGRVGIRVDGLDRSSFEDDFFLCVEQSGFELGQLSFADQVSPGPVEDKAYASECGMREVRGNGGVRLCFSGAPLGSVFVVAPVEARSHIGRSGSESSIIRSARRLRDDGVLQISGPRSGDSFADVFLDREQLSALPEPWARALGPGLHLLLREEFGDGKAVHDLEITKEFRVVEFDLVSAVHGGPVADAGMFVGDVRNLHGLRWRSDSRGRVHALVPMSIDGPVYAVVCGTDGCVVMQVQRHRLPRPGGTPAVVRVVLQPVAILDVRVTSPDGTELSEMLQCNISLAARGVVDDEPGLAFDDAGVFTACSETATAAILRWTLQDLRPRRRRIEIAVPALPGDWQVWVSDLPNGTSGRLMIGPDVEARVYPATLDLER